MNTHGSPVSAPPEKTLLVWILQTGEPLHVDKKESRSMRAMNLSDELVRQGHRVMLWSSAFNHQQKTHRCKTRADHQVNDRLEIRLIPSPGYRKNIGPGRLWDHAVLAYNLSVALKTVSEVPDVVFIGFPPIETAYVMSQWSRKRNVPYILDVKDLWPHIFIEPLPKPLQPIGGLVFSPLFWMTRQTMRRATSLTAMAPRFLDKVLRIAGKQKTAADQVFPLTLPPVESSESDLDNAARWWKERHGVDGNLPVIYFAGNIGSVFDFATVFTAVETLIGKRTRFQLVICGSGDGLTRFDATIKALPRVILPGWVSRSRLAALARMAVGSLAPYREMENFTTNTPNKIIDALCLGVPILCPLSGEVEALINEYQVGFRYSDATTLANQMEVLINDSATVQDISQKCKAVYARKFNFSEVYGNLVTHTHDIAVAGTERRF